MKLAIVIPVFNEEKNISRLFLRLKAVSAALKKDFPQLILSLIIVDDGSGDQSFELCREQMASWGSSGKIIQLKENCGKDSALMIALEKEEADYYAVIDADCQTPPELIPEMFSRIREKKADVINAVKQYEPYPLLRSILTRSFFLLARLFGITELKRGSSDFMIISKRVRQEVLKFKQVKVIFRYLVKWLFPENIEIGFEPEKHTKSTFSLGKLFRLALQTMIFFKNFLRFNYFLILLSLLALLSLIILLLAGKISTAAFTVYLLVCFAFQLLVFSMLVIVAEYFNFVKFQKPYSTLIQREEEF